MTELRSGEADVQGEHVIDPMAQLRLFALLLVLGLVLFFGLSFWGVRYLAQQENLELANATARSVAVALYRLENGSLIDPDTGVVRERIDPQHFPGFDQRMRALLHPLNVVKIKVFALNRDVAYSTDAGIIGDNDRGNARLEQSLAGGVNSHVQTREAFTDMQNETRLDVDVIETYVPMLDAQGRVLGAYEVYLDVTPFRERTRVALYSHLGVSVLLLPLLFFALYLLMRRSSIALERQQQRLRALADEDALTGVLNRRAICDRLSAQLAENEAEDGHVEGVLLVDVEHFHRINDQYGQTIGDLLLAQLAERLRSDLRAAEDGIGRFSGQQFLLLLDGESIGDLKQLAFRILQQLQSQPFSIGQQDLQITVRMGLTFVRDTDHSMDELVSRANLALFDAKQSGGECEEDRLGQA